MNDILNQFASEQAAVLDQKVRSAFKEHFGFPIDDVTTTEKRWFLSYPDGRLEPLNDYGSGAIRRCDNSRVTTNIVTETGVTTKSIVTRLSHGLSQPEGGQGQAIKCIL